MKLAVRFNFTQTKGGVLNTFYDQHNVVALYIFKSGWKGKYECVEEWGEYENSNHNLYDAEDINHIYGINTFLRKEKLDKINECTL